MRTYFVPGTVLVAVAQSTVTPLGIISTKWLNLHEPQFPPLSNGDSSYICRPAAHRCASHTVHRDTRSKEAPFTPSTRGTGVIYSPSFPADANRVFCSNRIVYCDNFPTDGSKMKGGFYCFIHKLQRDKEQPQVPNSRVVTSIDCINI